MSIVEDPPVMPNAPVHDPAIGHPTIGHPTTGHPTNSEPSRSTASRKPEPFVATRWLRRSLMLHRWVGLIAAPVLMLLGITGAIYLFHDWYDEARYHSLRTFKVDGNVVDGDVVTSSDEAMSPRPIMQSIQTQITAAQFAAGGASLASIVPGDANGRTTVMGYRQGKSVTLVYVHPITAEVLGSVDRDGMLMRKVRDLHGNLMNGVVGSAVVELSAYWLLSLIVTGLVLWLPRRRDRFAGVLYPRLRGPRRVMIRDIHSVPAFYLSFTMAVLVVTGLPWSGGTGSVTKKVQAAMGGSVPQALSRRVGIQADQQSPPVVTPSAALAIAAEAGMPAESQLMMPRRGGVYQCVYRDGTLSQQRGILIDPHDGRIIESASWSDMPLMAKTISIGIKLHQGELFGWPDFLIMLVTSLGVVASGATGLTMFVRRKWVRRSR